MSKLGTVQTINTVKQVTVIFETVHQKKHSKKAEFTNVACWIVCSLVVDAGTS